ncbi:MAG: MarC family protein [Planctomycetaceae bacterium]|nr:MarC family protein [Planctomycetaceae bacterium]
MNVMVENFLTFFATIDPIGTLTIFIGVTAAAKPQDRNRIAIRAIVYSAAILLAFVVLGQLFLNSIGIRLAAFELAGGIIFFLFGLQMVFGTGVAVAESKEDAGHDVAVFPIAVPSIASPGSILAAVVLTDNRNFSFYDQLLTTAIMLSVLGLTLVLLFQANRIYGWLGQAGSTLVVRIMGMVLAAIAVEMVLEALPELIKPLAV